MKGTTLKINITKKFDINIHNPTFLYVGRTIAGIPPHSFWNARGLSGHNRDNEKSDRLHDASFASVQTPDGEGALRAFLDETVKVFDLMTHADPAPLKQLINQRQFVFVTGIMRSGGTYLLAELSKIHDIPYTTLDMAMLHDRIPKYEYYYYHEKPIAGMNLFFELAQLLAWVNREMPGRQTVVKKHQTLSFGLPAMDHVFGESATYITTLRHPLTAAFSMAHLDSIDLASPVLPSFYTEWKEMLVPMAGSEEAFDRLPFYEKFLLYYEKLYVSFARYKETIRGKIIPVAFGREYETFLKNYAENMGKEYQPETFNASLKKPVPEALEKAEQTLDRVRAYWTAAGLEFPDLPVL